MSDSKFNKQQFTGLEKLSEEELRNLIKLYLKDLDINEVRHMLEVLNHIKEDLKRDPEKVRLCFSEWDIKNNDLLLELFTQRLNELSPSKKKN